MTKFVLVLNLYQGDLLDTGEMTGVFHTFA